MMHPLLKILLSFPEPKINTERGQQDLPVQMVPFAAVIVIGAVLFWVIYK